MDIKFSLYDYQKFVTAYDFDGVPWEESFRRAGYKNVKVRLKEDNDGYLYNQVVMDEVSYTHFVLKWS